VKQHLRKQRPEDGTTLDMSSESHLDYQSPGGSVDYSDYSPAGEVDMATLLEFTERPMPKKEVCVCDG
jgi:hypothetical protein